MIRDRKKKWGFLLALATVFCVSVSPVAWADSVKYVYYPSSEVYYNPVVSRYYYRDNGTWVERPAAPVGIQLGKDVSVTLGGPSPYVYHTEVIKQYPRTIIVDK